MARLQTPREDRGRRDPRFACRQDCCEEGAEARTDNTNLLGVDLGRSLSQSTKTDPTLIQLSIETWTPSKGLLYWPGPSIERTAIPRVSQRSFDKATKASLKLSLPGMVAETLTLVVP
jgi:hypothetical protein